LSELTVSSVLARSNLQLDDVAPFVSPEFERYGRRRVARTDQFEVLVMTWRHGQSTGPHDHCGVISVFKILGGTASETIFLKSPDSLVEPTTAREFTPGHIGFDDGDAVHEFSNDAPDQNLLISVHVYAPPLPEIRRFKHRQARTLAAAFQRHPKASTPTVAIVGGGFSGIMVAAQLARQSARSGQPLHLILIDRQSSIAEGAAYRTPEPKHLLNVPASAMSAWPDRPDDFLDWARQRHPDVHSYSFLQRREYADYLKQRFFETIADCDAKLSIEIRRDEVRHIERTPASGWRVQCGERGAQEADALVLATGHRRPDDPLARVWNGPRARYVSDPWAALSLASIEPHESVCLLGTGLTAIDVLLSLLRPGRTAPVVALSRRGLSPSAHALSPLAPIDPGSWLEPLLTDIAAVRTLAVMRAIRAAIKRVGASGADWRQVIDGLRPHLARIWQALSVLERQRFMRHARPFWEVARHRTAPDVSSAVAEATRTELFRTSAARVLSAHGSLDGVALTLCARGASTAELCKFDWIINCTGPGSLCSKGLPTMLQELIAAGVLEEDALGLGVRSSGDGRAMSHGRIQDNLVVIGTLRKPDLWESTAVPELRVQAAVAAEVILRSVPKIDDVPAEETPPQLRAYSSGAN
jgi:uncharacterized NAD(P)/FAD-binding protein YdhS